MKTALLICDHVPEWLDKNHGNYRTMFESLFPELNLQPFYVIDDQFPDLEEFDAFMVTGSKHSVYDELDWIKRTQQFIRDVYDSGKKLVGVCFGHQLIAESLGGKVEKSDHGYLIGIHHFEIQSKKPWMQPQSNHYDIVMLCQDQVTKLPEGSEILASSDKCPVGMYTVGDHFLGIQGHPEFTKEYNQAVFMSRKDKLTPEKIETALKSFEKELESELIRKYLLGFLDV